MYRADDRLVLSASDLVGFLMCEHFSSLELAASRGEIAVPSAEDPELEVLFARGIEHEQAYLAALEAEGRSIVRIEADGGGRTDPKRDEAATAAAMAQGVDVVYQGTFLHDGDDRVAWRGHADFLCRTSGESNLGTYLYEPEDTKLARRVKPGTVVQLCHYAEHVARLQGGEPPSIHVVLGGQERVSIALRDVSAYYRASKDRFVEFIGDSSSGTYPQPCAHCGVCRWKGVCEARWKEDDDLSLVAGLGRDQARKLEERAGIDSVDALARSRDGEPVRGIGLSTLDRLRSQARLQVRARELPEGTPLPYQLIVPEPERGLEALPAPSEGDLFFDMEGDPYVAEGGLEYLFGVGWIDQGEFRYRSFWAHGAREEKDALERFIDFVTERRERWPDLHVYHYAPYEPAALGRLMGRHGTREEEIDGLLRGRVLVDLYRVVKQALMVGVSSYSIKSLEPLYMEARAEGIKGGGESIVEYERWLRESDPAILEALAAYNRDDCLSTQKLRDWLEQRRAESAATFGRELGRPVPGKDEAPDSVAAESEEIAELVAALVPGGDIDPEGTPPTDRGRWLLAQLLEWHRREAKPEWWWYFRRVLDYDEQDLYEDTEAISGLEYEGAVGHEKRSTIHRYRFDPQQEHKLRMGDRPVDPDCERDRRTGEGSRPGPGKLVGIDLLAGTLDLKRGSSSTARHPRALIPGGPIGTKFQRAALRHLAASVVEHGIDGDGPFQAARDLVLRRHPRVAGVAPREPLRRAGEGVVESAVRIAKGLDGGCLPIQGPPGAGKTYTGARVIVALVEAGRRVGITANSHAVIGNLLQEVMDVAKEKGVPLRAIQKADDDQACDDVDVQVTKDNGEVESAVASGEVDVVAGTPWLFSRPGLRNGFQHLVIDEAGQLSLANVLAVAGSAENLILIGDPQQLAQPSKGTHPPGAGCSALEHVLAGHDTIPPDRGLFLDQTWRLHPRICAFVSDLAYEGRLSPVEGLEQQSVEEGAGLSGSGLRWLPVPHAGNRTSSEEEALVLNEHFRALLGRPWTSHEGSTVEMGLDQILVVAPYNAQVALLAEILPEGARVGTVDKFQGQEAPVVFISLAASSAEDVPRGMEFLYSRNRLNVAVSRARALAVVVASPTLLSVRCHSLDQLRLANGLCRFAEMAR